MGAFTHFTSVKITDQNLNASLRSEKKFKDLKVRIIELESREMKNLKDLKMYNSIMLIALMHFGGLVAVSSITTGFFREVKGFVVLGMVLTFFLFIVYPLYFGNKYMQALECSRGFIAERKRLYRSCVCLLSEYNDMCAVASPSKDVLLFKEKTDIEMKFFKNFRNENADLVYQTKYYKKFLLLVGIGGLIYAVAFISAFYVFFQDVPKFHVVIPSIAADVKRLVFVQFQKWIFR